MFVAHSEFVPSSGMDRAEMLAMQRQVREAAVFRDTNELPPTPVLGGADLAFTDGEAVAAVVAMRDGEVVDRTSVREPVTLPYIPGLLAFREAGPILSALAEVDVSIDVLLCDGNGRLHPREAGLATHLGVALDCPTVGVAKNLLCGALRDDPGEPYEVGTSVAIVPDGEMECSSDTILGYALQTRQWDRPDNSINPVYVSPGHRVSPESATSIVLRAVDRYKLPEPIRRADGLAGRKAREG